MRLFVVMGVAGCGKSTIGEAFAKAVGGEYLDGDSYHSKANIQKMSDGIPLTDDDRWHWLQTFGEEISKRSGLIVGGCSSLKRAYRERIAQAAGAPVLFVYLNGSRELISSRMQKREGHFMPTGLLDSQFNTLEIPAEDEPAVSIDIDAPISEIVRRIQHATQEYMK